ncbi:hypothetical protein T01_13967, partial [Trichinella spiralis]
LLLNMILFSCIMDKAMDSATTSDCGRISENPRWIVRTDALTRSSDVERRFIRMESDCGRISENPRWIMRKEAHTRSSDVERRFIRMERYF